MRTEPPAISGIARRSRLAARAILALHTTTRTDVVRRLEAGGTTLEESLALWERGEELARICQRWLDGAQARLDSALQQPQS